MTKKPASEFFAELFERAVHDADYRADRTKLEIAEEIYLAMQRKEISRVELAHRLGKSRSYISMLLKGSENLTLESLDRIADALSCELRVRFDDIDEA